MQNEKSIKQFVGEMITAFGDGIHAIQIRDAAGNVVKQSAGFLEDEEIIAAEQRIKRRKGG
jgi:hypothetical protein